MVVRLAQWSLRTPDNLGSNRAINNLFKEHSFTANCPEKMKSK